MIFELDLITIVDYDIQHLVEQVDVGVAIDCEVADTTIPASQLERRHVPRSVDEELQSGIALTTRLRIQVWKAGVYLVMDDEFAFLDCHATPYVLLWRVVGKPYCMLQNTETSRATSITGEQSSRSLFT